MLNHNKLQKDLQILASILNLELQRKVFDFTRRHGNYLFLEESPILLLGCITSQFNYKFNLLELVLFTCVHERKQNTESLLHVDFTES